MTAARNMHRRLDRIAKALPPLPTCRKCMYPQPESKGYIITNHRDPMKQCEGCGRDLDDQGVPMHQPYKRLILLRGERQFTRAPGKKNYNNIPCFLPVLR